MKVLNFTAIEILPSLLDKKKDLYNPSNSYSYAKKNTKNKRIYLYLQT